MFDVERPYTEVVRATSDERERSLIEKGRRSGSRELKEWVRSGHDKSLQGASESGRLTELNHLTKYVKSLAAGEPQIGAPVSTFQMTRLQSSCEGMEEA